MSSLDEKRLDRLYALLGAGLDADTAAARVEKAAASTLWPAAAFKLNGPIILLLRPRLTKAPADTLLSAAQGMCGVWAGWR